MKVNGEAIYASTASPFPQLDWGRCTKQLTADGATLYLHVFNWPADGKLVVPGLKNAVQSAYLLPDQKKKSLRTESSTAGVTIALPATAPSPISSTVVLKVKGQLDVQQAVPSAEATGGLKLPAAEARLHGSKVKLESKNSNIGFWTAAADWIEWQFNVAQAGRFTVTVDFASKGDSTFEIVTGNQKLKASVTKTGDYGKFQTASLGSIELPAGQASLAIKPIKEAWKPINLRSVVLKPAN
jgi:alpha-L-fucosidase